MKETISATAQDFEFGFHYAGPRAPAPDMDCTTCRVASTKNCPTHGRSYAQGCTHCASAQGAPCQGHWGMEAAIKEYASRLTDADSKADFDIASKILLTEAPVAGRTGVTVNVRADRGGTAKGARSLHIELIPRP